MTKRSSVSAVKPKSPRDEQAVLIQMINDAQAKIHQAETTGAAQWAPQALEETRNQCERAQWLLRHRGPAGFGVREEAERALLLADALLKTAETASEKSEETLAQSLFAWAAAHPLAGLLFEVGALTIAFMAGLLTSQKRNRRSAKVRLITGAAKTSEAAA